MLRMSPEFTRETSANAYVSLQTIVFVFLQKMVYQTIFSQNVHMLYAHIGHSACLNLIPMDKNVCVSQMVFSGG